MKKPIIGFTGLSHLGQVYSSVAANKGFNVIAFDEDKNKVYDLEKNYKTKIDEPGLQKLIKKNKKRLQFTSNIKKLKLCNIIFVSLDVKTNKKNLSDIKEINNLINKLKRHINKNVILIILSQIPSGFTKKINWEGKNLFYQVETLVIGDAIKRCNKPEQIILGCKDKNINLSSKLENYYNSFNCPILKMNYESAELAKKTINAFLASSLSMTNSISEICENTDARWDEIIPVLKNDKRIGKFAYLNPGLGISGGNIERDIINLKKTSNKINLDNQLFNSIIKISNKRKNWAFNKFKKISVDLGKNEKLCILGLSYKPNTNSIKNSPAIKLLKKLSNYKFKISVYDPKVTFFGNKNKRIYLEKNIDNAISGSRVVFIMTAWKQFNTIKVLKKVRKRNLHIIDPFGTLKKFFKASNKNYYSLGLK